MAEPPKRRAADQPAPAQHPAVAEMFRKDREAKAFYARFRANPRRFKGTKP